MTSFISYCGLDCKTCPIFLATLEKDLSTQSQMRISIAEQILNIYGTQMRPEEITDCDGCRAENGRLFTGCRSCKIRLCASHRNIENCAFCAEYSCEKLREHFVLEPYSEKSLDRIRRAQSN